MICGTLVQSDLDNSTTYRRFQISADMLEPPACQQARSKGSYYDTWYATTRSLGSQGSPGSYTGMRSGRYDRSIAYDIWYLHGQPSYSTRRVDFNRVVIVQLQFSNFGRFFQPVAGVERTDLVSGVLHHPWRGSHTRQLYCKLTSSLWEKFISCMYSYLGRVEQGKRAEGRGRAGLTLTLTQTQPISRVTD